MKYFQILLIALIFVSCSNNFSNMNNMDELLQKGYVAHESGDYKLAIKYYKRALEIDPSSSYANYEIAYSYVAIEDYSNAKIHCKKVLEIGKENLEQTYVLYGSVLDLNNESIESINVLTEATNIFPTNYLIYYNLGVTQFKLKRVMDSEKSILKALEINAEHWNSHLLLSEINLAANKRAKAILPIYYYLLINPKNDRSNDILEHLHYLQKLGVSTNNGKNINITLFASKNKDEKDTGWSAVDMMLGMTVASHHTSSSEEKKLTEMDKFIDLNKSMINTLSLTKKDNSDYYWDFYVAKLLEISNNKSFEEFSYYISQSDNKSETKDWLNNNYDKFNKFDFWVKSLNN